METQGLDDLTDDDDVAAHRDRAAAERSIDRPANKQTLVEAGTRDGRSGSHSMPGNRDARPPRTRNAAMRLMRSPTPANTS